MSQEMRNDDTARLASPVGVPNPIVCFSDPGCRMRLES